MSEADDLRLRIAELEARLDVLLAPKEQEWRPPTLEVLRQEIEHGPLAGKLAALWSDVFEPHPTMREKLKHREGKLKSDAAFDIHKLLTSGGEKSRSCELGWGNDWPWKDVLRAHQELRRAKRGNR